MRHPFLVLGTAIGLATSLAGCGKELGRVPFSAEGSGTANATLAAGDVDFWTDIAVEYKGSPTLEYKVDLQQGGKTVASATCNPLGRINVKMSWVETDLGDSHSRKGNGKMQCSVKLPTAGATTINATLVLKKDSSITLTKADLVVKQ